MKLPYVSGLDGLRAIAVIAVLLYHAELPYSPLRFSGGFLGVEVFFVLSGYLITSLLLAEWRQAGRIDLPRFWQRRARRLVPAEAVLIVGVLAYAAIFLPDEVTSLRLDAAAAAGHLTNWWLIADQQSYFESWRRPSLFRHLWSLAIEQQFYIACPLLVAAGLRMLRPSRLAALLLAGAVASAVAMALLEREGAGASRLYYGTDTRAAGLLAGSAMALVCAPGRLRLPDGLWRWAADGLGGAAALGLVAMFVMLEASDRFLYEGAFPLVAVLTAVAVAAAIAPGSRLGAVLGLQPLRWIGLRSYSIYLWHWPVFMLTRPELDVSLDEPALFALRLGVTALLAEASYRLVEKPAREGALGRLIDATWRAPPRRRLVALPTMAIGIAGVGILAGAAFSARAPEMPAFASTQVVRIVSSGRGTDATVRDSAAEEVRQERLARIEDARAARMAQRLAWAKAILDTAAARAAAARPTPTQQPPRTVALGPTPVPPPPTLQPTAPANARVTAIGDSVMVSAATDLSQSIGSVDLYAQVGLQVSGGISELRQRAESGALGEVVLIHLGNNGEFTADQIDEIMRMLPDRQVVFVNVKVPRAWEDANNTMLAASVARYANATLVDWHTLAEAHPEYFWSDGIHLRPEGAEAYSALIMSSL